MTTSTDKPSQPGARRDERDGGAVPFLTGADLGNAIKAILAEDGAMAAVAFWGAGCERWVTGTKVRVIANLRMGGTNPHALGKIAAELHQCDTLHAKVYIGSSRSIVCSANASINGLALEGTEQAGWIEAGTIVPTTVGITDWFNDLWDKGSRKIGPDDWAEAKRTWDLRKTAFKPSLASFSDFDADAPSLPLITWIDTDSGWNTNEDAVAAVIGARGPVARRRVDEGLWIRHPNDVKALAGRWVLVWRKLSNNRPGKAIYFLQMSSVFVRDGFSWSDGELQDVLLGAELQVPPPFDPDEPRFRSAMATVLADPEFASLLEDDAEAEAWYAPRVPLMRHFWKETKRVYLADAAAPPATKAPTEAEFAAELMHTYKQCELLGYTPTGMLGMMQQHGAIETARRLLASPPSEGFKRLALMNRLDLAIENIVQREPWRALFTEGELRKAAQRLR